jgi:catechol 2,3-dioxygenase-like lactoylglutathione lyase family enzyme
MASKGDGPSLAEHPSRLAPLAPQDDGSGSAQAAMIDHVSIPVRDLVRSAVFYEAVLATLGYAKLETRPATIGFGKRYTEFWLNHRPGMPAQPEGSGAHVALRAASREMVDAFHAAALVHGGASDGAPGLRPQHGEGYYAAFIRDPDGNRIEAVTFLK